MTNEEAKKQIYSLKQYLNQSTAWYLNDKHKTALDMAISALSKNKGEWIESKERSKHWYCSVCGGIHTDPETGKWRETFDYRYPFCPNCGADMRGEV